MNKNMKKKSKKGFTLIELVVVIAILGILAAILIPVIGGFITRARISADEANARNLYNCASMAIATGATAADVACSGSATVPAVIRPLFGATIPDGHSITIVVTSGLVASATYSDGTNSGTYSRPVS